MKALITNGLEKAGYMLLIDSLSFVVPFTRGHSFAPRQTEVGRALVILLSFINRICYLSHLACVC